MAHYRTEKERFKKEAEEWLKPFGYSIHITSETDVSLYLSFICYEHIGENYPAIECSYDKGKKTSRVYDSGVCKMFISLTTGDLMFKHPEIERFINLFRYYANLIENNQPTKF
jgi:hypothetical protein